jgi:hypothetical protein
LDHFGVENLNVTCHRHRSEREFRLFGFIYLSIIKSIPHEASKETHPKYLSFVHPTFAVILSFQVRILRDSIAHGLDRIIPPSYKSRG